MVLWVLPTSWRGCPVQLARRELGWGRHTQDGPPPRGSLLVGLSLS